MSYDNCHEKKPLLKQTQEPTDTPVNISSIRDKLRNDALSKYAQFPSPHGSADIEISSAALRLSMLLVDSVGGQWYIFDPESANIILVPEQVAAILRALQSGEKIPDELLDAVVEMFQLGPTYAPIKGHERGFWAMTIHLNHACNLACEYCYADGRTSDSDGMAKGAYGGSVTFMKPFVLEYAVEKFMRDAPTEKVTVGFCGGEALLSEQRFLDAVKVIDTKASKYNKQVSYEMTTNGTMFTDAILQCLKEHDFSVAVSLDGDKETHDHQRPMANGKGSYDQVMQGLERLSKVSIEFGVRMTAFRGRPGLEKNHYALTKTPAPVANFNFNMYGEDARRPLEGQEREDLFNHYREVAQKILERDQEAAKLTAVREVLVGILTKRKKQFQCGAGRWDRAVTPSGDVYPCHRFVGMSPFKLGNVINESFKFASHPVFEGNAVKNRVVRRDGTRNCALCYAHHVCGGGCAQIAAANTGKIGELPPFYCQETRLRVQAVVRTLVEKMHGHLNDANK